jgi:hypothetical protein
MTPWRPSHNWWNNPDMKIFSSLILISFLAAGGPTLLWAHGGGHDAEPKKEETTLPELPEATIGMKADEAGGVDYGLGDSMDAFEMEEVGGGGPLWGEEQQQKMPEHEGHDMSQMKHVEPAEHEWVATSQIGYGWAAALTLFSGALFGFLTLKRPCE